MTVCLMRENGFKNKPPARRVVRIEPRRELRRIAAAASIRCVELLWSIGFWRPNRQRPMSVRFCEMTRPRCELGEMLVVYFGSEDERRVMSTL